MHLWNKGGINCDFKFPAPLGSLGWGKKFQNLPIFEKNAFVYQNDTGSAWQGLNITTHIPRSESCDLPEWSLNKGKINIQWKSVTALDEWLLNYVQIVILRNIKRWPYGKFDYIFKFLMVHLVFQHHELPGDRVVSVGYGSNDHVENAPQRYCSLQSDGQFSKLLYTHTRTTHTHTHLGVTAPVISHDMLWKHKEVCFKNSQSLQRMDPLKHSSINIIVILLFTRKLLMNLTSNFRSGFIGQVAHSASGL
jgi:hypothetical protein